MTGVSGGASSSDAQKAVSVRKLYNLNLSRDESYELDIEAPRTAEEVRVIGAPKEAERELTTTKISTTRLLSSSRELVERAENIASFPLVEASSREVEVMLGRLECDKIFKLEEVLQKWIAKSNFMSDPQFSERFHERLCIHAESKGWESIKARNVLAQQILTNKLETLQRFEFNTEALEAMERAPPETPPMLREHRAVMHTINPMRIPLEELAPEAGESPVATVPVTAPSAEDRSGSPNPQTLRQSDSSPLESLSDGERMASSTEHYLFDEAYERPPQSVRQEANRRAAPSALARSKSLERLERTAHLLKEAVQKEEAVSRKLEAELAELEERNREAAITASLAAHKHRDELNKAISAQNEQLNLLLGKSAELEKRKEDAARGAYKEQARTHRQIETPILSSTPKTESRQGPGAPTAYNGVTWGDILGTGARHDTGHSPVDGPIQFQYPPRSRQPEATPQHQPQLGAEENRGQYQSPEDLHTEPQLSAEDLDRMESELVNALKRVSSMKSAQGKHTPAHTESKKDATFTVPSGKNSAESARDPERSNPHYSGSYHSGERWDYRPRQPHISVDKLLIMEFDGTQPEEYRQFISQFEALMESQGCNDDLRFTLLKKQLRGDAALNVRYGKNNTESYQKTKAALELSYGSIEENFLDLLAKVKELPFDNVCPTKMANDFSKIRAIADRIEPSPVTDSFLIRAVGAKLPTQWSDAIAIAVEKKTITTWEQVCKEVITYIASRKTREKGDGSSKPSLRQPVHVDVNSTQDARYQTNLNEDINAMQFKHHGPQGYQKYYQPSANGYNGPSGFPNSQNIPQGAGQNQNRGKRTPTCFICEQSGHVSLNCTLPWKQRVERCKSDAKCFRCFRKDHPTEQCASFRPCFSCMDRTHNSALCQKVEIDDRIRAMSDEERKVLNLDPQLFRKFFLLERK